MRKKTILWITCLVTLVLLLSACGPATTPKPPAIEVSTPSDTPVAPAGTPRREGRISFVSDRDGNFEIYVMNADGSGLTNLTNNPAMDAAPSWSPDGTVDLSQRPSEAQALLQSAFEEPSVVGQALKIFGSLGTSDAEIWRNLYRVYDLIADDVPGKESTIIANGWATRSELRVFRQTAQPERHYQGKYEPPEQPMSLNAAKSLVRRLLQEWLHSKSE